MSMRINTNVTALTAQRNLEQTSNAVSNSIERLSSGLRINSAADDPAGLIISEGLKAQVDGIGQAVSNAQDANNLIKTAEGGLSEVNTLLRSVRQLALHAANTGVNDSTAVSADQTQIASALASIDRIAAQTQFGNKKLLDGTSGVAAAVTDTTNIAAISIGGTYNNAATVAGGVTVSVTQTATRAAAVGTATYANVNAKISDVNGTTAGTGGTMVINGQSIQVAASDTVQATIDKINNMASVTGVGAQFVSDHIELTQQSYGANSKITYSESSTMLTMGTPSVGTNAIATVTVGGVNATFTGGQGTGDSGLKLTDTNGNTIMLTEAGNTNLNTAAANTASVTQGSLQFQIGANSGQSESFSIQSAATSTLGTNTGTGVSSLKNIDVTTAAGAANAIKVIDQAIAQVSVQRAQMGAFQKNTLDSTIRSLGVTQENLSASVSQITDTNVAQEVVSLTKNQILQQAGMSVLSQANQAPQQVLSLLR